MVKIPLTKIWGAAFLLVMAGLASDAASREEPDHAARGRAAMNSDFPGLKNLCDNVWQALATAPATPRPWKMPELIRAAKPFDNLVFLGNRFVSSWAIKTSAGLILIDALSNEAEARKSIEGGLRELGLDPADIRFIVITHGHGDHYGGAHYLADKYQAQVIMGEADWQMLREGEAVSTSVSGGPPTPKPGRTIKGREKLTLGDTTIQLILTPGHTPGTVSLIFPVLEKGLRHTAALWGGNGFNFPPSVARFKLYAASAESMRNDIVRQKVDVVLSNHPFRDLTEQKLAAMLASSNGPNPFVLPPARAAKAFEVFRECALAQIDYMP